MQSFAITNKLIEEARRELAALEAIENSLYKTRDDICFHSWRAGRILIEIKEEIGHGKWLIWLRGNWPQHELRAQRCMAFFRTNEDWKENKSVEFYGFDRDSVRKLFGGYTPAKERLALEGDYEINPGPHHLTFINQFSKYDRQLRSGQVESFSAEAFRREIEPMIRRLIDICGRDWILSLL
jgi:hypothetical protein